MGHYVYKYVLNNTIIYIGKSDSNLEKRLNEHGKTGDNISKDAWDDINAAEIYYIEVANSIMSDVIESELIRRYKPKYNIAKKSDWDGLPFEEPEWKKYKRQEKEQKIKNFNNRKKLNKDKHKKTKKDIKKDHSSSINASYLKRSNEKCERIIEYIIDCLTNNDFYMTNYYKYNYAKKNRDQLFIIIKPPKWYIDDTEKYKYEMVYCEPTGYSTFPIQDMYSLIDKQHMLFWTSDLLIKELNHKLELISNLHSKKEHGIPKNILVSINKLSLLNDNWNTIIANKNLYVDPPEDYGKSIKKFNDSVAIRNNNYFWKWYVGCSIVYTDGHGYYLFNNDKKSKYICNYDKDFREYSFRGDYFLEEDIDYYFSYWAEIDNVLWITSLGSIWYKNDIIGHFDSTSNDIHGKFNIKEDIKRAIKFVKDKNLALGTGKFHEQT